MPTIEGLSPSVLWTTIYGFIALCLLITIVLTAAEKIRGLREVRKQQREAAQPGLADQISKKVLDQLEPRLNDIENKLKRDKTRIDNHEILLNNMDETNKQIRGGLRAYGKTMLVLLNHGNLGDSKEVREAADALNAFLADQI